jgi:antitoxin component of MazEF toxin-antitoxin module
LPQTVLDAAGLRVGDDLVCRLLDNGSILLTPRKGTVAIASNQVVQMAPKKPPTKEQICDKW